MNQSVTFGSVCSGIEAASVAWDPLGWRAVWLAEIEKFPSAVLAHHYPNVPNLGDMTKIAALVRSGEVAAPDVLVGGTPCQAFSVAGLRAGLSDPRGALTLAFVDLANAIDSTRSVRGDAECVVTWENVPGVLSSKDNAFGCFLGALAGESCELEPESRPAAGKSSRYWKWDKKAGKHAPSWPLAGCVFGPQRTIAWRVTDAQYFGVAQRRRRVFVVASARKGFDPTAVLFELEGVRRDSAPSREAGQDAAADAGAGAAVPGDGRVISSLDASYGRLQGCSGQDMNHGHSHLVPTAFGGNRTGGPIDISPALLAQPGSGWKGDFESETFLVGPAGHVVPMAHVDTMPTMTSGGPSDTSHNQVSGQMRDQYLVPCITGDIAHTLKAEGFDASEEGTGRGTPIVPVAYAFAENTRHELRLEGGDGSRTGALSTGGGKPGQGVPCVAVAFQGRGSNIDLGQDVTGTIGTNADRASGGAPCVAFSAKDYGADAGSISPKLRAMGHGDSHANGGGQVAVAFHGSQDPDISGDVTHPVGRNQGQETCVAYSTKLHNTGSNNAGKIFEERTTCLDANSPPPALLTAMQVRRLTPRECERLQSFPDDYTLIPWGRAVRMEKLEQDWIKYLLRGGVMTLEDVCRAATDGPRYKALGNSMCVYNMRWIGRRIAAEMARGAA